MAEHTIEARIVVTPGMGLPTVPHETIMAANDGVEWTFHYDGYDMSPWGGIVIKRASFNDKGVDTKNG